jgi:hypothetical protein
MEWIKCSDRLPREFESVIISVNGRIALSWWTWWNEFGFFHKKRIRWYFDSTDETCEAEEITHWMPLHDPPTAAKPLLAAAVPCSHEDIYLRKSGIWKCKQCGKVFY